MNLGASGAGAFEEPVLRDVFVFAFFCGLQLTPALSLGNRFNLLKQLQLELVVWSPVGEFPFPQVGKPAWNFSWPKRPKRHGPA